MSEPSIDLFKLAKDIKCMCGTAIVWRFQRKPIPHLEELDDGAFSEEKVELRF